MHLTLRQLRESIKDVLLEGRVDELKKKYPDLNIDDLVAGQPIGSNNKYLEWCVKMVSHGEAPTIVLSVIKEFHDQLSKMPNKDINFYKSLDALRDAIPKRELSKRAVKDQIKSASDKVYDDGRFLVVRPHSRQASCVYGAGTKWCTAASKDNYFARYSSNNARFYYIIDRENKTDDEWSKIAYVKVDNPGGRTEDVYTATDVNIPVSELRDHFGSSVIASLEKAINEFDAKNSKSWHKLMYEKLPIDEIQKFWRSFDYEDKLLILKKNPSFREQDFVRFANSPNDEYRLTLASRVDCAPAAQKILATDVVSDVRAVLASTASDASVLSILAQDSLQAVRANVYRNKRTPPEVFELLRVEKDPYVLFVGLNNKKFPQELAHEFVNYPVSIISTQAKKIVGRK